MIFISVALRCEALPFIRNLALEREPEISRFPVYGNDGWKLIISGVGKVPAAAAATFLLTKFKARQTDLFFNVGICGAGDSHAEAGEIILCNKILDADNGRVFFPDMLWKHPFEEGAVETFSKPVGRQAALSVQADYADMEAAGAFEAASFFLPPHQIAVIKVVSDHLEGKRLIPAMVTDLVGHSASRVIAWLRQRAEAAPSAEPVFSSDEEDLLARTALSLRLSATMVYALRAAARYHKLRDGDLAEVLAPFGEKICASKKEGKRGFAELRKKLVEP